MNLQKKELELLFILLRNTSPNLADARVRDTFLKPLGEALENFVKEKSAVYIQYCIKNEDGTPDTTDGNYHFKDEELPAINAELNTLFEEEVTIPIDVSSVSEKLKTLIESTTYSPKPGEAEIIDGILAKL